MASGSCSTQTKTSKKTTKKPTKTSKKPITTSQTSTTVSITTRLPCIETNSFDNQTCLYGTISNGTNCVGKINLINFLPR